MVKNIIGLNIALLLAITVFGQDKPKTKKEIRRERINQLIKKEEEGSIIFNTQTVFGARLNSDGYALSFEIAKFKTPSLSNRYELELGEHKSNKEVKFISTGLSFNVNSFIYGKANNFYYTKLGFGQQRLIGSKGNKNGVAVSLLYGAGFSAGLLKPYVLEVINNTGNGTELITYDRFHYDPRFVDASSIIGSPGFLKGWDKLKFVPGGYAKVALRFDYGRYNKTVTALETGLNIEGYQYGMPIMANIKAPQIFFNAYIALMFGSRK